MLSFQDNGIGLNLEKYNRHLFGLYKRFHTDAPGRALGLFMVRLQVELLGGKVSATSEENKGMTISIVFE